MRDTVAGQFAIIIAAGSLIAFTSPLQAATQTAGPLHQTVSADQKTAASHHRTARRSDRHHDRSAQARQRTKIAANDTTSIASKPRVDKPAAPKMSGNMPAVIIPASVANANAELLDTDAQSAGIAPTPTVEMTSTGQDAQPVVAADQVNDIDRAATGLPPPHYVTASMESRDDTDVTQTSLIGRIFIAIGGLLTVGSAMRMFIA